MRSEALRYLPLRPDEYWRLTISELSEMLEGVTHREELEWERTAWLATHIVNMAGKSVKKNVSVHQLLNREKPKNPEKDFKELMIRQKMLNDRRAREN